MKKKISNLIIFVSFLFSTIIFFYVIYKSEIYWDGTEKLYYKKYCYFSIFSLLFYFICFFLKKKIKIYVSIFTISVIFTLYLSELFFSLQDNYNIYIDEYKKNYPNINFNSKIDNNITFNFDQSYIDIILNNLFKNSIEALNDTKSPQIELILSIDKKNIKLVFFDNGPGFDGDISDLLKPYFSTKNSSGLGLSLINKIINENNGDLIIKTNKYSGFKVEIIFNV